MILCVKLQEETGSRGESPPPSVSTVDRRALFGRHILLDVRHCCIKLIDDINNNMQLFQRSFGQCSRSNTGPFDMFE